MISKQNKEGFALLAVMILGVILAIAGSGLLAFSFHRGASITRSIQESQAFWAAEGGLEYAKTGLRSSSGDTIDALPEGLSHTVGEIQCTYTLRTIDSFTSVLYAETTTQSGKPIIIKTACYQQPLTRYAWGAYTGGCWETWGRDLDGGLNGVNKNEESINWGNAVLGGPFFTYDTLSVGAYNNGVLTPKSFGETFALDFYNSAGTSLYGTRAGAMTDGTLSSTLQSKQLSTEELSQLFTSGYNYLTGADEVLALRNTGDGTATYDACADGTIIDLVRENYEALYDNTSAISVGDSTANPDAVYEVIFNGSSYEIYQGQVYFEASVVKGAYEQNRGDDAGTAENLVRYYMDLDENSDVNFDDNDNATDKLSTIDEDEDLPIFFDLKYERDNDTLIASGTIDSLEGSILAIDGDVLVSGVVDGYVTVVGADNMYIGEAGLTYASAPSADWSNWDDYDSALNTIVSSTGESSLMDAVGNHLSEIQDELTTWTENNIDDMVSLVAKRQVVMLGDDTEEADSNVHASVLIGWDVDPYYGLDIEVRSPDFDEYETGGINGPELASIVPGLTGNNNDWEYNGVKIDKFDIEAGAVPGVYMDPDGQMGQYAYNPVLAAWDLTKIKKNGQEVSAVSADGLITTDTFYKDYATTGMAPWDKYSKDDTSMGNIFGGMSEYRHSRFSPGSSGLKRNFFYDWRLQSRRTKGIESENYSFYSWEVVQEVPTS
jgi:hypothetical protein